MKNNVNEPKIINTELGQIYDTFEDAYMFMKELDSLFKSLYPKDLICSRKHIKMLIILRNTAEYMIKKLKEKYKAPKPSEPPIQSRPSYQKGTDEYKIQMFIKKYHPNINSSIPDKVMQEFAKKFSEEHNIPYEKIWSAYVKDIHDKVDELLRDDFDDMPNFDKTKLNNDPLYNKAEDIRDMVYKYYDCCEDGRWTCDDPFPPINIEPPREEKKYTYTPLSFGDNSGSDSSGGKRAVSERRIIRLTESDLIKLVKRIIIESEDETYDLFGVNVKLDKDDNDNIIGIKLTKGVNLHDYGKHLNQDILDEYFDKDLKKLLRLADVDYSTTDFHSKASWGIDIEQLNQAIVDDKIKIKINGDKLKLIPGYKFKRFKFFK